MMPEAPPDGVTGVASVVAGGTTAEVAVGAVRVLVVVVVAVAAVVAAGWEGRAAAVTGRGAGVCEGSVTLGPGDDCTRDGLEKPGENSNQQELILNITCT